MKLTTISLVAGLQVANCTNSNGEIQRRNFHIMDLLSLQTILLEISTNSNLKTVGVDVV